MGKINYAWQEAVDRALTDFESGAIDEDACRHRLHQLGIECDDAENHIWAVRTAKGDAP